MGLRKAEPRTRAVTVDGRHYELIHGPDRGEWLVARDGVHWAFVLRENSRLSPEVSWRPLPCPAPSVGPVCA